jgi:uncharacterized protein (DUF2249 family)
MQDIALATTEADARAAAAVEQHHAQMAGTLAVKVEELVRAASAGDGPAAQAATASLVRWCTDELVPHALAEEKTLYVPAQRRPEGRLLVDGMLAEHQRIVGLVGDLQDGGNPVRMAATAAALQAMFDSHLAKENELVLPLLLSDPDVSVADLLGGMHELLGASEEEHGHAEAEQGCGHQCGCGETDGPGYPELDARAVPHAIRHATVFGALDAVRPGGGLVLLAPHDPLPLLRQVEERTPGVFRVDYLERGPEVWRLAFVR